MMKLSGIVRACHFRCSCAAHDPCIAKQAPTPRAGVYPGGYELLT
jgi:hypothetical protein